jgi:energy-coupling factor transport system permease protein
MSKILIGRYVPGDGLIYKLDPRGKLLATFVFIAIIFLANNWQTYLIASLFCLAALVATHLKPRVLWDGVKPLVWLIVFTSLLQLIFTAGGHVYWQWGIFVISAFGIQNAIFIFLRFLMVILISTVLTLTTMPLDIARGMASLLKPLKFLHVPVEQISLVLAIALRFVPTLMDETVKIMNAQRTRGADFNTGGLIKRAKTFLPVIVPLFISSLNIALDLSLAMEARGYREGMRRTHYRELRWSKYDWWNFGFFALLTILLVIFRTK